MKRLNCTKNVSNLYRGKGSRKRKKKDLKELDKDVKKKLKEYKSLRSLVGRRKYLVISNQIDCCLGDYNIDRAAFHGGALLGTHCLEMENKIDPLFEHFESVLTSNP